ncbi:hypothetical protein LUZ62_018981 [Rhynchospora pubera]|uniref:Uncharacterized protein n=1 Tax=Rhynchospora pubera TaxID=906938 RepID=A0AAV8GS48_9POAL|nr:hypothetical protein LUZ62_000184 [Rhynchospora pubera]KAJ4806415.1 hypothetical protein LUZ62_018981 [Rhynchospora pubera]
MQGSRLSENISYTNFYKLRSREVEKDKLCSREVEEGKEVEKDEPRSTEIEEGKEEKEKSRSRETEEEKREEKKPGSEKVKDEKKAEKDKSRSKRMEEPFKISRFRNSNCEAILQLYKPRMVSIGPYYSNTEEFPCLKEVNSDKQRLLKNFLSRSNLKQEAYVKELQILEPHARKYYSESDSIPENDEFVNMLLLDGCFILECFFMWLDKNKLTDVDKDKHTNVDKDKLTDIDKDTDVLFTDRHGLATVIPDLLLFGNQIPFIVIDKLFNMVMAEEADETKEAFINLLAKFLMINDHPPPQILLGPEIRSKTFCHILDLYHYFLDDDAPRRYYYDYVFRAIDQFYNFLRAPSGGKNDQNPLPLWKQQLTKWTPKADQCSTVKKSLPGAVELHKAGVKFKKNSSFKTLFDVKFDRGILEIPPLQLDSDKKILLANLLALEKHEASLHQTVTSYVTLMDSLINTKEDVAFLQRAGIIHNKLDTHKNAAVFFNQLGERLSIDNMNPYFARLVNKVQGHYNSPWNHNRARLMQDYFHSPWAIISVIAGGILLGLTLIQTFFTVYPYYRPSF